MQRRRQGPWRGSSCNPACGIADHFTNDLNPGHACGLGHHSTEGLSLGLAGGKPVACGKVVDKALNKEMRLSITGPVTCSEALKIADRYFSDPSVSHEGSGGASTIGLWYCISDSAAGTRATGHIADCKVLPPGTDGRLISLDKP